MREKFIEAAPKLIAEAFSEVGVAAVPGEKFEATHNRLFGQLLNEKGMTIYNDTVYKNKLDNIYSRSMPYGDWIEMLSIEVESFINETSVSGTFTGRDAFKEYLAKINASYSALSGVLTAPITIYDKAARRSFRSAEDTDKFYYTQLLASRNSMEFRKYLLAKELIHIGLRDMEHPGGTLILDGIENLDSEGAALRFAEKLGEVVLDMTISTQKYNAEGFTGQAEYVDIYMRPKDYAKYRTQLRKVFHEDPLLAEKTNFVIIDDFGGRFSNVDPIYRNDGQQIANMLSATWQDPHADVICVIAEPDALIATIDWDDVEEQRDAGARSTTFHPQSSHHFAIMPSRALVQVKFDGPLESFTFTPTTGLQEGEANAEVGAIAGVAGNETGGTAPYTYALTSGVGSTDNANFEFDGNKLKIKTTALTAKTYKVRIKCTDADATVVEKAVEFEVLPA